MGRTGQQLKPRDYCAIARKYAEQVDDGTISACKWVRMACRRQLDDLERAKNRDYRWNWDRDKAEAICKFAELLPHIKGRWKTATIQLEPWQIFFFTTIFGWVDRDSSLRRFRKYLLVVPRKNAKSTMAAIIALFLLCMDREPGAEVYSAATTRDQAKIVWETAKRMVERTAGLRETFGVEALAHSIAVESNAAFFKPLSRDADSLEGLNPSGWNVDELHAHSTREVFDVLDEATGSRLQPLGGITSTEGDNSTGIFAEQVKYGQEVLAERHDDDTYFALIYTIDEGDDWTARETWYKANPNLGVSVFERDMEVRCKQAQANPQSQSSFLTKRLNVRTGAGTAYFNMLAFGTICRDDRLKIEDFYGQPVIIGLDLSSKRDIAGKVYLFHRANKLILFAKPYIPEDSVIQGAPNYDFYRGWSKEGYLTLTDANEGKEIDFGLLAEDLTEDAKNFDIRAVGYDAHQATQFSQQMRDAGLNMVEVPQTVLGMSEPMKDLEAAVVSGRLQHDGHPVLGWCFGNVTAKKDRKENVYPRKERDDNKIDLAVAAMIANHVALRMVGEQSSMYENPATAVM